jgi:FdhD protein
MNDSSMALPPGIEPGIESYKFVNGKWQKVAISLPKEMALTIYINTLELVTILCTPTKLNCLVLGYLFAEGIINDIKDVASMRVCEEDAMADVKLEKMDFKLPEKRVLTSGCGGGVSFNANISSMKIESNLQIKPEQVLRLMKELMKNAGLYNLSGGIHTSAISDGDDLLAVTEDIGRHNTLDKIIGECLLRKIPTRDKILLTSGRVSSEMLRKAAKMQAPLIASLTSPTDQAVLMARELGIILIGYARGSHLTVYANPTRLQIPHADNVRGS